MTDMNYDDYQEMLRDEHHLQELFKNRAMAQGTRGYGKCGIQLLTGGYGRPTKEYIKKRLEELEPIEVTGTIHNFKTAIPDEDIEDEDNIFGIIGEEVKRQQKEDFMRKYGDMFEKYIKGVIKDDSKRNV